MSLPVSCPQFSRVCDVLDPGFLLIVCSEYSSSDPPSATVEQNEYSCSAVQELLDGHFVTLDENSTRNIAQLGGSNSSVTAFYSTFITSIFKSDGCFQKIVRL